MTNGWRGSGTGRGRGPRSRRLALAAPALLGACALLLAGCGSGSSNSSKSGSSGGSGGGSIIVGYENNGADPSLISVNQGYFKKELGSGVQLKLFTSGPAALSAIASGALHFMCGLGVPPAISAIDRKVPLVVVWNQERYTTDAGIVAKQGSGINKLADLKGKTIAITTGSEASFELPALLQVTNSGISIKDVKQLNMSPPQMQSAWATGQIKAAIVWDPTFDYLATHGGKILATDASLPVEASSYNICVANKKFVNSHKDQAAKFIKAMSDGVDFMKANPAKATTIMAKEAGIDEATAKKELSGYHIYTLADQVTPDVLGKGSGTAQAATTQSMTNNWKVLHGEGFLADPPPSNMAQYVDSSFAEAALKKS